MPLWRPYETMLNSKIADLNNVATGGYAGSITAALFLRRFVTAKSWVHFDIFAWTPSAKPGRPEGAECQMARAIYALLRALFVARILPESGAGFRITSYANETLTWSRSIPASTLDPR